MATAKAVASKKVVKKAVSKTSPPKAEPKEMTKEEKQKVALNSMNEAALLAKEEFDAMDKKQKAAMTAFFTKWYAKAGWKRLGRMIVGKEFIKEID